ncbi:hypothetical protein LCGC14_1034250 [marine sediment metagenome]|uniref:DUF5060 domain-containing protein n=2 Tax=root TaxID=1 RepID=A0A831VQR8_9FLAO|nr:DUF5060 domain-containing protein [Pricia antarctica]
MHLQIPREPYLLMCTLIFVFSACNKREKIQNYVLDGSFEKWHPITLTFDGPQISETDADNPFLNYALQVDFQNGKDLYTVHGFYAADGDAAETSANSGNKWQVKFAPPKNGEWQFKAYFAEGTDIGISQNPLKEKKKALWKSSGSFEIIAPDSTATGFYKTGKLAYVGKHYLEESETGKPFIKNGVGSPENFLAYHEFDDTFDNGGAETPTLKKGLHEYIPHVTDWKEDNFTWGDNKGKGIIGALNYLANKGMNSLYFITMNVAGDGDDVWPWTAPEKQTRYDVSKLAQWDKVFTHMDGLGMAMNVFTQETENDSLLNQGELGLERKLYYKELVSRFGHHLAIVWNLGEETNRTTEQLKSYADYIRSIDPYKHPIAVHNHIRVTGEQIEGRPLEPIQETFSPLLGYTNFEIPSLQLYDTVEVHHEIKKWRDLSLEKKRPWTVYLDEIGPYTIGVTTDSATNNNYDQLMHSSLWGSLLSGGAGTSWYFGGLDTPNNDLSAEDFRTRDQWWDITVNAKKFFNDHLPFSEMQNQDELLSNEKAYCFAKKDEFYVVYLPKHEKTDLKIGDGAFTIAFYDPKVGGMLLDKQNEGWKITKPNSVELSAYNGQDDKDWVIVIKKK